MLPSLPAALMVAASTFWSDASIIASLLIQIATGAVSPRSSVTLWASMRVTVAASRARAGLAVDAARAAKKVM